MRWSRWPRGRGSPWWSRSGPRTEPHPPRWRNCSHQRPPTQPVRAPDRATARAAAKSRYRLSDRELDVWLQLPDGLSNNQIGERLFISGKTVSVHVTNILRKLAVKTRVQAIALAYQLGMVDPPLQ